MTAAQRMVALVTEIHNRYIGEVIEEVNALRKSGADPDFDSVSYTIAAMLIQVVALSNADERPIPRLHTLIDIAHHSLASVEVLCAQCTGCSHPENN